MHSLQDVRVGRHRDKLELIRDSLRPFEQAVNEVPTSGTDQATTSAVGDPSAYSPGFEQQRAMVDSLIAQGYEQVGGSFDRVLPIVTVLLWTCAVSKV